MKVRYVGLSVIVWLSLAILSVHANDTEGLRHWEIPSKDPDRIILTFNGDPATSRAVTWRTDTSITQSVAQIAEATVNSKFTETALSTQATTETLELGLFTGNKSLLVHYHSVNFEGLKPDTQYVYRVGDGAEHWSEWIQFRTAKAEYAPTQFVYFGDAQNSLLDHWSRVIRRAYQTAPDAAFAIHAGDLVNRAHRDYEWAEWFKAGSFIHSQWTAIPVVGNHEFSSVADGGQSQLSIQWRPQFTLPVEQDLDPALHEAAYTVDYQDIRIIVLNSTDKLSDQTKYLERQLKDCDAKWKIITCHHSIFAPAKGRNFLYARMKWKPLLDQYGVDLVLNGHDHTYLRGHVPVRTTEGEDTENLGTIYVTSVSGPKMYELDPEQVASYAKDGYQMDQSAEQTQFYQVITIKDNELTYIAYTALGEEYDRAVIMKDFDTGKKMLKD